MNCRKKNGAPPPINVNGSRVKVLFDSSVKYHDKNKMDPSYEKWNGSLRESRVKKGRIAATSLQCVA